MFSPTQNEFDNYDCIPPDADPETNKYNHLLNRVPMHLKPHTIPYKDKKTANYIDKTLSIGAHGGQNSLNEKLRVMRNKFFTSLTKNYKPKASHVKGNPF